MNRFDRIRLLHFALCSILISADVSAAAESKVEETPLNSLQSVTGLVSQSRRCKIPAPFNLVDGGAGYKGRASANDPALKIVDRRNWYQYVDLDGDGLCEVEAEGCNRSNAVDGSFRDSCANGWLVAYRYRNGYWAAEPELPVIGRGEVFRGSLTFKYFDAKTGKLRFIVYHDYFAQRNAASGFGIDDYSASAASQGGGAISIKYDEFDDLGPFQHGGAYIPFLDIHVRRLLAEYEWRRKMCGGKVGYKDVDGRTATLEDLVQTIRMFLLRADKFGNLKGINQNNIAKVKSWHTLAAKVFDAADPSAGPALVTGNKCISNTGKNIYVDVK